MGCCGSRGNVNGWLQEFESANGTGSIDADKLFEQYDKSGDLKLSKEELRGLTQDYIKAEIKFMEFALQKQKAEGWPKALLQVTQEKIKETKDAHLRLIQYGTTDWDAHLFETMDLNGDGSIGKEEFKAWLETLKRTDTVPIRDSEGNTHEREVTMFRGPIGNGLDQPGLQDTPTAYFSKLKKTSERLEADANGNIALTRAHSI